MSSTLYEIYEISDELSQGGVWIEFSAGVRVLVARADRSNASYIKTMRKIQKRKKYGLDSLTPDEDDAFIREILIESLVLDFEAKVDGEWVKGIPLRDGLVSFGKEALETVFKDLPDFARDVLEEAQNMSNFAMSRLEESKKN